MIETFAVKIDSRLLPLNGKAFYSGRAAFSGQRSIYVLGHHPGGDPAAHADETIIAHTRYVLSRAPGIWSAYCDESWKDKLTGQAPLQLRVKHLLLRLDIDPRLTPSSNLIFIRRGETDVSLKPDQLIEMCWPVHEAVLEGLRPRAIICLGVETAEKFRQRIGAHESLGLFEEKNNRNWRSHAWRNPDGLLVFGLAHPSRADWTNPASDPSGWVQNILLNYSST